MWGTDIYFPILKKQPIQDITIIEERLGVRFSELFVLFSTTLKDIEENLDKKNKFTFWVGTCLNTLLGSFICIFSFNPHNYPSDTIVFIWQVKLF